MLGQSLGGLALFLLGLTRSLVAPLLLHGTLSSLLGTFLLLAFLAAFLDSLPASKTPGVGQCQLITAPFEAFTHIPGQLLKFSEAAPSRDASRLHDSWTPT